MKKIVGIILMISMFSMMVACSNTGGDPLRNSEPTIPVSTEIVEVVEGPPAYAYNLYIPNEHADGFDIKEMNVAEISAESVLSELKSNAGLREDVQINDYKLVDGVLYLDFNQAFADVVCSTGTSGEFVIVGSVVNTFISAFQVDYVYFSINSETLESGHVIYDFPMGYFE